MVPLKDIRTKAAPSFRHEANKFRHLREASSAALLTGCSTLRPLEMGGLVIVAKAHYVLVAGFGPMFRPFAPVKLGARSDKIQRSTICLNCTRVWLRAIFKTKENLCK
jgi:hypothetical protein